jgi:DNA-binding NarL/FixJ family response regulator
MCIPPSKQELKGSLLATGTKDYPRTMKKNPVLALIIAAPSPLQDGLLALMTTSDLISAVLMAEEASLALRMVKDHHPNLVLLDSHLDKVKMVLGQIKNKSPQTRCLALVGSVEQEQTFKEADAVLLEGFSPSRLMTTIEELLEQPEIR